MAVDGLDKCDVEPHYGGGGGTMPVRAISDQSPELYSTQAYQSIVSRSAAGRVAIVASAARIAFLRTVAAACVAGVFAASNAMRTGLAADLLVGEIEGGGEDVGEAGLEKRRCERVGDY